MKAYRPEFPRWMSDIDILILDERFQEALDAVRDQGYILEICPHSAGLRDPVSRQNVVDLHRFIQMGTGKEKRYNEYLKQRSLSLPLSSMTAMVPSPEDMVFVSLVNFWKNFTNRTSERSVANVCFDLKYLKERKDGFDWDIIRSNASLTGTVETVYLSAWLLSSVMPDYFPSRFLYDEADLDKAESVLSKSLRVRNVLCPLRDQIGEFNIMKAIRTRKPFFKYISLRAKYFLLKRNPFSLP